MTPHIHAKKGEIAKLVIMPGDPLRAKFIAETFLDPGFKLVNEVRNMFMFTGTYKGKPVTIAGSGMGCPSMGIYSYELFKFYDVEKIVRIGTTGAYLPEIKLYETMLVTEAYSDQSYYRQAVLGDSNQVAMPSVELNKQIENVAHKLNIPVLKGRIHSSDVFYSKIPLAQRIEESKAIAVEMESYALFTNAEALGKKAACLLTISDNIVTHEETSPAQRQTAFTNMMKIALGLALED
ncbi:purine-nucleoside phosphorylase [Mycoplasmopsis columbinasalis]|uniref:Uridine phosphorylase n=1 Tax=Mycoplasmopsis columbinasalis TaxID=114880 RepID=A0A449B9G2_9BACT|nr:purine-nucleoside phosphorylase [Mycoplasmopsis columbinasalis]VEU77807.1 purine-nucleoside phosphorylase [Mycoplasmopsis columbinasalis]